MDYVCVNVTCDQEMVAVTDSLCGDCGQRTWWNDETALTALLGRQMTAVATPVTTSATLAAAELTAPAPALAAVPVPMPLPSTVARWELPASEAPAPAPVTDRPVLIASAAHAIAGHDGSPAQAAMAPDAASPERAPSAHVWTAWAILAGVVAVAGVLSGRDRLFLRASAVAGGAGVYGRRRRS